MTATGTADVPGTLYVAHLEPAYRHARHYIGWTEGAGPERWAVHESGQGSPLIRAAIAAGCSIVWHVIGRGTKRDERRLHDAHRGGRVCPTCRCVQSPLPSATRY